MKRCAATGHDQLAAPETRRATFIVRMWTEADRPDRRVWRGTLEHVQSGERRAVADTDGLLVLLTTWLSEEPD